MGIIYIIKPKDYAAANYAYSGTELDKIVELMLKEGIDEDDISITISHKRAI